MFRPARSLVKRRLSGGSPDLDTRQVEGCRKDHCCPEGEECCDGALTGCVKIGRQCCDDRRERYCPASNTCCPLNFDCCMDADGTAICNRPCPAGFKKGASEPA